MLKRAIAALLLVGLSALPAQGAGVVLANRTEENVKFAVRQARELKVDLESGDLTTIEVGASQPIYLKFESDGHPIDYELDPNSAYYFFSTELGGVNLEQIGYSHLASTERPTLTAAQSSHGNAKLPPLAKIPVKIVVDEEERMARKAWEERLRKRVQAASSIFERLCRVRFVPVAFDTWESNNDTNDFNRSLAELEHEVSPAPGRLVIGFTSQYAPITGPTKLGGTRAAFFPYILVREWAQYYTENERLEMLVHELAHYLGAVHSAEPDSVMRPMLGDRQARRREFRVKLDPLNALAIYLVGEQYRARGNVRRLIELPTETRMQLWDIYTEIDRTLPQDPAGKQYLTLLGHLPGVDSQRLRPPVGAQPQIRAKPRTD